MPFIVWLRVGIANLNFSEGVFKLREGYNLEQA